MNKQTKIAFLLITGILTSVFHVYAEDLKLGAALALTGDQAEPNAAFREGIQIAIEEFNKANEPHGDRIALVVEDSHLTPKESVTALKHLTDIEKINVAILGSAIEAKAGSQILTKKLIPGIVLWDSSPKIERLGNYIFSIGLWTPGSAEVAARFGIENFNAKTAVVFNSEEEWSKEVGRVFKKEFEANGGEVLVINSFPPGEVDFRTAIFKSLSKHPDVVYTTVGYNIPTFFKQLRAAPFNIPVITSDIISDSLLIENRKLYEGVFQTQVYFPDSKLGKKMLKLYEAKFNKPCKYFPWVAWGYDAVHIAAKAWRESKSKQSTIRDEISKMKSISAVSGIVSFDGQTSRKYPSVFKISSGEFILAGNR